MNKQTDRIINIIYNLSIGTCGHTVHIVIIILLIIDIDLVSQVHLLTFIILIFSCVYVYNHNIANQRL